MFYDLEYLERQFNSWRQHFLEMQNEFIDELHPAEREEFHDWFHQHEEEMELITDSLKTMFHTAKMQNPQLKHDEVLKILINGVAGHVMFEEDLV